MPWKCPACQTQMQHEGVAPKPKQIYRCHVCHLELVLNEHTDTLIVAPMPTHNGGATDPKP